MNWVQTVTQYFQAGYYTPAQVAVFVAKGKITAADYQTITGQAYDTGSATASDTSTAATPSTTSQQTSSASTGTSWTTT
jgi:uncharacterized XkdX family phage protein